MKTTPRGLLLLAGVVATSLASAETVIVDSDLTDSYYFVDTYEVLIDAPAEDIWPHLLDVASWMFEFSMIHESGPHNAEGEVFRLYEGQDFFVEIAKILPGKLLVLVNLPSTMQDEESVGIGMTSLTAVGGKTLVSHFMSRHYDWSLAAPNPLRERRASQDFQENTRVTWDKFLNRLRELAEGTREPI
jgi:hypothetical protein